MWMQQLYDASERAIFTFHIVHVCTARWQISKMSTPLKSLVAVFTMSLLPSYCLKDSDYFENSCSDVACDWCVSLNTGFTLALNTNVVKMREATIISRRLIRTQSNILLDGYRTVQRWRTLKHRHHHAYCKAKLL